MITAVKKDKLKNHVDILHEGKKLPKYSIFVEWFAQTKTAIEKAC